MTLLPISVEGLEATSYGGWPSLGFAAAVFIVAGRGYQWWVFAAETLVVGVALSISYSVFPAIGLIGSLAVTLPALLSWQLLTRGGRVQLTIVDMDRARYHLGTAAAAVVCALFAMAAVAATGVSTGDVPLAGLMSFLAALTAQLVVVPLTLKAGSHRAASGPVERWAQRCLMVATTVVVFAPTTVLPVAFVIFPVLAWAAMRTSAREALVQLFAVGLAAYAFTYADRGPMATVAAPLPADLTPALLYLFVAALAYLIVPLTLSVERLLSMTTQATRAAVTVERLIDSASQTVFIATDGRGRITHYNSGAQRALGYTREEVLGRSPTMFHSPEEIARQAAHFGVPATHAAVALAQAASQSRRDWAFLPKDGPEQMISLSLSEVTDSRGDVVGFIGAGEDITERMRAHRALSTALAREHASVVRLQEVDHVKQELVSNVSHELRTPITSIAGYAELLSDHALGELNRAQSDAIHRIERNSLRLGLLVEDLLTMSRAEAGQLLLDRTALDLREVVTDAFEMVEELVRVRELDVHLEVPDQPVTLLGDRHALERVGMNLLSNAIKFTPDGGAVTMTVHRAEDGAALAVSDTGIGIAEEDQKQLFTRFFRSSSATANAIPGTGLGLSIVHAIVTQHGGMVSIDSAPGEGTTITALFPWDDDRD